MHTARDTAERLALVSEGSVCGVHSFWEVANACLQEWARTALIALAWCCM